MKQKDLECLPTMEAKVDRMCELNVIHQVSLVSYIKLQYCKN